MMDNFSLARPAEQLIMGDGSGPDGLARKDGAKALSGAASVDTATTQVDKPSRTKTLITECIRKQIQLISGIVSFAYLLLWVHSPSVWSLSPSVPSLTTSSHCSVHSLPRNA